MSLCRRSHEIPRTLLKPRCVLLSCARTTVLCRLYSTDCAVGVLLGLVAGGGVLPARLEALPRVELPEDEGFQVSDHHH